jgi:hypothetical protein
MQIVRLAARIHLPRDNGAANSAGSLRMTSCLISVDSPDFYMSIQL